MANDSNIFKNSLTAAGYVTPEEWSRQIEQVAREASIMRGLTEAIVVMDRIGTPGNTEYIQKNAALSASDLTDGDSVSISTLSFSQISVSASQIAVGVQITLKQLRDQLPTVRSDTIRNLGLALNEKEEDKIFTELYTSSNETYPSGVTSGTITSSDTLSEDVLIDAQTAMRVAKRKGLYLIVHPEQYADLAKRQQFTDASYLGSDSVTRQGFIGRFFGVDVFESTNVTTVTENSTTVYQALLLGPRALVILDKNRPTIEMDRNLIQDLSMTMVAHQDAGYQILNEESVRLVKTA